LPTNQNVRCSNHSGRTIESMSYVGQRQKQPTHLPSQSQFAHPIASPEGWIKKVDRAREGKVWVGYFHAWEQKPDGTRVRRKKEKTLGPVTKPKLRSKN